jgi:MFS family permease
MNEREIKPKFGEENNRLAKEKPQKEKVPGRGRTQVTVNIANVIDSSDGQILPALYQQIGTDLGLSALQLGTITGVRSLLQSVTTPIWGWWSDKHSRKLVLSFGCFFWAVFTLLTAFASTFVDIMIWRAITGIGLAVIVPTTQSILADYFPPERRGKAFGWLGLTGVIGSVFGTIYATALVADNTPILGIAPWRFVFVTMALISIIVGLLVLLVSKDPIRGKSEHELEKVLTLEKAEKYKVKRSDYVTILKKKTFLVILLQGVVGSIPWNGIFFMILWWEYMGFDSLTAGLMFSLVAIGAAIGNLLGGWIGDRAARWRPKSGRLIAAQISVFSGIPLTFVIFILIPMTQESMLLYILFGAITGLLISWCGPQNSTIFSEIFEPEKRSTVYSVDRVFEGSVAALGTVIVGLIAGLLGYVAPAPGQEISMLPLAVRTTNMIALAQGMFIAAFIPWILCLVFYTLAYRTYPSDVASCRECLEQRGKELAKMK